MNTITSSTPDVQILVPDLSAVRKHLHIYGLIGEQWRLEGRSPEKIQHLYRGLLQAVRNRPSLPA